MNAKARIEARLPLLETTLKISVLTANAILSALEIKKTIEAFRGNR